MCGSWNVKGISYHCIPTLMEFLCCIIKQVPEIATIEAGQVYGNKIGVDNWIFIPKFLPKGMQLSNELPPSLEEIMIR